MDSVGKRLRLAIGRWGSIRSFQAAMEKHLQGTDVDGWSYPSINEYLKGAVSPRLEFLEPAAAILGVRLAWLASGDGEPTEEEERAAQAMAWAGPSNRALDLAWDAATEAWPVLREAAGRHGSRSQFSEDIFRLYHALPFPGDVAEADLDESLRAVGFRFALALRGPLDALAIEPQRLPPWALHRYVEGMGYLLRGLVAPPEQSSDEQLLGDWTRIPDKETDNANA